MHRVANTRLAKQAEQLGLAFGQSLVAGFLVTEKVLDDMKGMLDLGPDAGLFLFDGLQQRFTGPSFIFLIEPRLAVTQQRELRSPFSSPKCFHMPV